MGVISRKIFPACANMCVCCPALRSRSRQPVKRYKKLLAEIFPKSLDDSPSERKIAKLCEYAAKNPIRIPKIAKYLEDRCFKELRCEHIKFINIVAEAYNKLLCVCKEQMAYFAVSLLNVVTELLDNSKQDAMKIIGCQTLTRFIYSQLWFMAQFSLIFADFDEIVHGILDNYEPDAHTEGDSEQGEPHHNWVDEVIRFEGRSGAIASCDTSPHCMIVRPRPEKKNPSLLTRHLRKSLQATVESVGEQESNSNILLQNSIEDCLLEIAKGIGDVRPLFDLMAITLEKLPSGVIARASIGSLMSLAHMISVASASSCSQQVFPEGLLVQLLKVMLHPDVEARVGAHQIFSALLIPSSNHPRHEASSLRNGFLHHRRRWHTNTASASITALLEKLRREKDGAKVEMHGNDVHEDLKERDIVEEDWKQGGVRKHSPNFYKISSIIDRTAGSTSLSEAEPQIMKFSEEQIAQLLSAFWMQASLPDNLPANIEAIAHSFVLTLLSSGLKNPNDNLVVRFFQLPLSLRNVSLDPNDANALSLLESKGVIEMCFSLAGMSPPACQRSIFVLSMGMLMFAAKIYHIPDLNDLLKSLVPYDVDPYLGIGDDLQVYVKPQADIRVYGSDSDNQLAASMLIELRNKMYESDNLIMDIMVRSLSSITEMEEEDLTKQLSESFTPDDAFMFGPQSILGFDRSQLDAHSKKSMSFDGDFPINSLVEDDAISEASVADLSRFIPKMPSSPSMPHVISIGQLLESGFQALVVAGQVAGTSVTTSPLPYNTMASHCEALGTGTRKKLSNWLAQENHQSKAVGQLCPAFHSDGHTALKTITSGVCPAQGHLLPQDSWFAMKLPPASPFDNFLKAAGC
ncbi:hypothetical protein CJ030_MR8G004271 [Morella rubra]|uniref:Uncharacterized protein n=1 Tax=Morella rubra TaxID=262757 RepID=A0A6A1UNM4_9ROSI|nr:hypothetical protein CJ030_MR8G004271 [Morella rubra]